MAQASKNVRKLRRMKRERSIAFRMLDMALVQRDQARMVAVAMEKELAKRDEDLKPKGGFEMIKVEEGDTIAEDNSTARSDTDGSGLEVSEI